MTASRMPRPVTRPYGRPSRTARPSRRAAGREPHHLRGVRKDEWWPKDIVGRRLAAATRDQYATFLDVHLVPRIGDEPLAFIDAGRVIDLRASLAEDGVPDYTSARTLKLFRQILGFAVSLSRSA